MLQLRKYNCVCVFFLFQEIGDDIHGNCNSCL